MAYYVKSVSRNHGEEIVDTKSYPDDTVALTSTGTVRSTLDLLFQGNHRSFGLKHHKNYRIILIQEDGKHSDRPSSCYELFSTNEYTATKLAFNKLLSTLTPLLLTGVVLLTKQLLAQIIYPEPLPKESVAHSLVEVMEKDSGAHPEWMNVVSALLASEGHVPPTGPTETKLDYFKKKFLSKVPKSCPVHETSTAVGVEMLTSSIPLLAASVPKATKVYTDTEVSDRIWTNIRRGTLRKFDSQGEDDKKTWLIDAVEKQYLKSALKLVLSGVSTNDQHSETGDTALHMAVRLGNLTMVKLLLACQADPTVFNASDETPLSIAKQLTHKDANDIYAALEEIRKLQVMARFYCSQNTDLPEKKETSDTFLLSLDGGGMRSVIMCHILATIDRRMKELDSSCKPIQSYFDYIAGTSAGAIIGGLSIYGGLPAQHLAVYLYKFMVDVFGKPKANRGTTLKGFLTEMLGEETTMSAAKDTHLITTATIANVSPNRLHLMTSYGEPRDNQLGPDQRKVWEALVASAAAPTYFPAFHNFLDGGLMANNPTLPAMTDIFKQAKKESRSAKIGCVLSLGTGYVYPEPVEDFEVFVPGFSIELAKNLFKSSRGMLRLLTHFAEQTTQSNGEVVSEAEMWCDSIGASFFRFSPPLIEEVEADMCDPEKLTSLLFQTELYVLQECANIDKIAKIILSIK